MELLENISNYIKNNNNLNFIEYLLFDNGIKILNTLINNVNSCDNVIQTFVNMNDTYFNNNNITYTNLEKIPSDEGCIIISNHNSIFDYGIINKICDSYCVMLNSLKYCIISDNDLYQKYKLIVYYNKFDISNNNGEYIKNMILELTNNKKKVVVFPEGSLSIDKYKLNKFKKGLFFLAYDNNIPIIPIFQKHRNYNIYYPLEQIINVIFNSYVENLKVDVTIQDVIRPSEFKTFDEFYNHIVELYSKEFNKNNKY